ncbi:MAG: hypothetical protein A2Z03_06100 [Chloroflexi bacterium RBG_16_56_8]|nr:MAG: hypothetical protein A2Z03_06100 [Chloroflexi bacterium RBG_16_56_8]
MKPFLPSELVQQLIRTRRSVRHFSPAAIPSEILERILETATWAPSAHNRQPWRFVVLRTVEARGRLAEGMGAAFRQDLLADGHAPEEVEASVDRSQQRILSAPAAILLCLDMKLGDVYPDPVRQQAEYLMGVQSVALAGGTLLLAAHAEGLGGVWVCAPLFARNAARRALELPAEWEPQGLIFLGYPEKTPDIRPRVPLATVTWYL